MMKKGIGVFVLLLCVSLGMGRDATKSSRESALFDSAIRLQGNLSVLMLSFQPGYEDMEALAYFRLARGADVTSAYVTNGGLLEDQHNDEYPHLLSARRRYEAAEACENLGVESYFMNFPDLGATPDTSRVWELWNRDSLRLSLLRIIAQSKPDIILLTADRSYGATSVRWKAFKQFLLSLLQRLQRREPTPYGGLLDADGWRVNRVLVEADSGKGFPTERMYPPLQKSLRELAREARQAYTSVGALGELPEKRLYQIAFLAQRGLVKELEQGLPHPVGKELQWLQKEARSIGSSVGREYKRLMNRQRSQGTIQRIVTAIDTAVYHLKQSFDRLSPADRRVLLHWNQGLEDLRILLLGVGISYSFSETVLTNAQLTFLTIDTVYGLPSEGTTELYFPDVGKQWVLNEGFEPRTHLHLKEPYRLLSPRGMKYDLPAQEYGLEKNTVGTMFSFYLIHNNPVRWKSFVLPIRTRLLYAPKFTVEVFNPIIRLQRNESVLIRLTNHSRDGVADTLTVSDSLIVASRMPFRLSTKGSSVLDTLRILEAKRVEEGSYLVGLEIDGENVGQFAARAIDVAIDSSARVGLLTNLNQSVVAGSLRRLGVQWRRMEYSEIPGPASVQTLIIDRTTMPADSTQWSAVRRFAEHGGAVVILPQTPEDWNRNPLIPGVHLSTSQMYDEGSVVDVDSTSRYLSKPNMVSRNDWDEWLWFRTTAFADVRSPGIHIPARIQKDGNPLLITEQVGSGSIVYVNLALHYQLLNVHPGALRLLANLVAR